MGETKTVSVRIPLEDLERFAAADEDLTEFIKDAVHRKARDLWLDAWAREARSNLWKLPPGGPDSTAIIRKARDER